MTLTQAKAQLRKFVGDQVLTFSIEKFENGEWVARCNQIPAITTCGMDSDVKEMEDLMKDAILTAAGIDGKYADKLLRDASLRKEFALTL